MSGELIGAIVTGVVSAAGTAVSAVSSSRQKSAADAERRKAEGLAAQKQQAKLDEEAKLEEERRKRGQRGQGSVPLVGDPLGGTSSNRTGRTLLGG